MAYAGKKYFEDIQVGDTDEADATYVVTEDEIIEVGTRWDPQPFHTKPEAAAKSIFGGLVASSVHLFAIYSRLCAQLKTKFIVMSALGFGDVRLHAPARPGDILMLQVTHVPTRRSRSHPDCGILETTGRVFNQNGELVLSVVSTTLIKCATPEGL